jgi:preprotein translocase subunit SecA
LAKDPHHQLVNDTVKEYGRWACFDEEEGEFDEPIDPWLDPVDLVPPEFLDISIPYRRASPKVGRNEPCVCGSGKKYKKCCGQ